MRLEDRIERAGNYVRYDDSGCVLPFSEARSLELAEMIREYSDKYEALLQWADDVCQSSESIDHWGRMQDHYEPRLKKIREEPPQGKDDDSSSEVAEVERTQQTETTPPKAEALEGEVSPVAERFLGVRALPPRTPRYLARTEDDSTP